MTYPSFAHSVLPRRSSLHPRSVGNSSLRLRLQRGFGFSSSWVVARWYVRRLAAGKTNWYFNLVCFVVVIVVRGLQCTDFPFTLKGRPRSWPRSGAYFLRQRSFVVFSPSLPSHPSPISRSTSVGAFSVCSRLGFTILSRSPVGSCLVPTFKATPASTSLRMCASPRSLANALGNPSSRRASLPALSLSSLPIIYAGKRVLFLKQLERWSTSRHPGPFKIQWCASPTGEPGLHHHDVDLDEFKVHVLHNLCVHILLISWQVEEKLNDAYFAKSKAKGKQSNEEEFSRKGYRRARMHSQSTSPQTSTLLIPPFSLPSKNRQPQTTSSRLSVSRRAQFPPSAGSLSLKLGSDRIHHLIHGE